ncbi:uncharacterized protein LOC110807088 [Carica papaya]|uniref:uncharacterized protein LOC110807088 n=1 Tax=Carica papaya TaxID=3649 RepID=UPI000B8CD946|nr:uncharacterized protein LOC110807088 [Carica papaya]
MAFLISSPEVSAVSLKILPSPKPKCLASLSVSGSNEKIGTRARIRVGADVGVRDCKVRVAGLDQKAKVYGHYTASVKRGLKQNKEEEEKQNYYVNMGYAIRALREDFPELFYRELRFDIYRDDIVFKDPLNTFVGIENYKSIFWGLRFHGRIFFRALWLDIINVWQPMENVIMVRWTVHGVARVPWESHTRFDGTSEYKLDKNGKIYEHRVDNIAPSSPPKFHVLAVQELIQSIGCTSTPKPTYFEVASLSSEVS